MFNIVNVEFLEYYSNNVPKELLQTCLMDSLCDTKGKLKLELHPGRKLIQSGPYILPPIRWLESFEPNAEFNIVCDVQ